MKVTVETIKGCPTMTVAKGNIVFIYDGMDFILCKVLIKYDSVMTIEITNDTLMMELEELLTDEEHEIIGNIARAYV